jgi:MFS transporter, UMF1 family
MLDQRRSIYSWAMYDWANSAFATTVMAGFFPLFFNQYWADPSNPIRSVMYLGWSNSIASIIVALMAPFLGAVADRGTAKKKFLMLFAFLGIIMTGGLWLVAQGMWKFAAFLYVLASVGFAGGNVFYDSLLPGVASEKKVDFVSGLGFALGYIGGGLLFAINVLMFLKPAWFGIPDGATAIKLSFLSVAVWWTIFSVPIFLFVKEPKLVHAVPIRQAFLMGWKQLVDTFREIRHLKIVGLFLLAYWLYIDGVDTIIRMAVSYGDSLGFDSGILISALLITQFVAFFGSLGYVWFAKKIGVKESILVGIGAYCIITLLGYFMNQSWHFLALAIAIGLFQGGIQAMSRSLYTRIIPKRKAAEFFGFYNMLGKFAAVVGPVLMGTIGYLAGSQRLGILSILLLFIAGGFLLMRVNITEGEIVARKYLAD